jgi:hypothetical protein
MDTEQIEEVESTEELESRIKRETFSSSNRGLPE